MRKALDAFSTVDYNLKRRPTQIDNQIVSQSYVFPIWKRRDRWPLTTKPEDLRFERKRNKEDDRNKLSEEERIIKKKRLLQEKKVNVKEDKAKEFYTCLSWYSEIKNDI